MSRQSEQQQAEEPLEQGPVSDAGPRSDGGDEAEVVDATVVEEPGEAEPQAAPEAASSSAEPPAGDGAADAGGELPPEHATAAQQDEHADGDEGRQPSGAAETEPPETPLQRAERERGEYLELAQRSRAELENFRKRAAAQAAAAEVRGKAELARRMVPALDNLERALLAAGIDPDADAAPTEGGEAVDALAGGVNLVLRELRDALRAAGVESFNPAGERFDPNLHEAIATGAADGAESGTVIETTEKGYRIGEQVLRPARVVVAG